MMCRFPARVALAALLGSTAFLSLPSAFAQTAPAASPPQTPAPSAPASTPAPAKPGMDKAKADNKAMGAYQAFFDAKLAGLHAGLELTPEQAPLWTPVEAAIRDLAKAHALAHRGEGDEEPGDTLAQLKRTSERLIRSGQAMKALADATGPLLATLSDDQKERLPKLIDGLQPKTILAKAFNLPEEHDADHGERDAEDGHHSNHHRHRDEADDDRDSHHGFGERGRDHDSGDRDGGDHEFRGRAYGNGGSDHDFGDRFYRDHERHGEHGRGDEHEAERHHEGPGDHDDVDRDRRGPDPFRHRSDSDDERT